MKRTIIHHLIACLLALLLLTSCEKEIFLDYKDIEPVLVVEGRITNEGCYVNITQTRSMNDSVISRCLPGAIVTISSEEGITEQLIYDAAANSYISPSGMTGTTGATYHLNIVYNGRTYTASSTMPPPAPFISAQFIWQPVLDNGLLMYEFYATDPQPEERNFFWYRIGRRSVRTDVRRRQGRDPYRWSTFSDRGSLNGIISRDVMCVNEEMMKDQEIEDEDLKGILFEGDTVSLQLMTIDHAAFDYYQSLSVGQRMGDNPKSTITGGCMGYFLAGNISRWPTVIYRKELIIRK